MKRLVLFLFIITFTIPSYSTTTTIAEEDKELNESYKYKVAKQVFINLINAKGDNRMQMPEFVMSSKKRYVAWMSGKNVQVGLEEAAYDVCVQFGKDSLNALAALLGHEITHYYEKHTWGSDFSSAYANLEVTTKVKTSSRNKDIKAVNETEADYLGGFLAYSAGYPTFGIVPTLLMEVYTEYGLSSDIPGYPSLEDRTKLAVESEMRLEELINAFEAANYLIILEDYESADHYLAYILKEFQSREIYNNAGVNAATAALSLVPEGEKESEFAYPLQLDGDTRLDVKTRNTNEAFAEKDQFISYLRKAERYFEQAIALDGTYATAYVNLACVKDLLGAYDDATYLAKKGYKIAKENGDNKVIADAYIIRGIATIHEGEPEDGRDYIERAKSTSPLSAALADLNLHIIDNNGERPAAALPATKLSLSTEKVDDFSLSSFMDAPDVESLMEITNQIQLGVKQLENSKILLHLFNGGEAFVLMQLTNDNYSMSSGAGIQVGSSRADVISKYGDPSYSQETRTGQFMVYKAKKAIFRIKNGVVDSWCVYRK